MSPTFTQLIELGRTGMSSRMLDLDTVSNNLANFSTTGYKQNRVNFQEVLNDVQLSGVRTSSSQLNMDQGAIQSSTSPLHMMVDGIGFFGIRLADGSVAYTRDGTFSIDANAEIVDTNGNKLIWDGDIPADVSQIDVDRDGTIKVTRGDSEVWQDVGNITLYQVPNPSGMTTLGNNLLLDNDASGAATAGSPGADGFGQVVNYALEGSNVDIASEMTHLIRLQRFFEVTTQTVQQSDTMLSQAIRIRQ
jgi:flagellar basal-body rod protein FlgG